MTGTIVVSQLGARMHYAVPRIFEYASRLEFLYTDICATKGWPRVLGAVPSSVLPSALRRLRGRIPHGIPPEKVHTFEMIGLRSVVARMRDVTRAADTRIALRAAREFSNAVVSRGFGRASGFYGIAGECLEQLQAARARSLFTAVEQIIAPREIVDNLVGREMERYPDWEGARDSDPFASEFAAREKAEWASADMIVCASTFVRDGVAAAGGPAERCVVVPYGVESSFGEVRRERRTDRLRVITIGAAGLRKGSPYVLEVARRLQRVAEFRIVGPTPLPYAIQRMLQADIQMCGTVPRSEVARHYAWADVFLLPSVCEGSATVVYEALAAGLPVITTPNAGSVVRDGEDGFIVPFGDIDSMTSAIEKLANNRLRDDMAASAARRAADFTVERYGERLLAAIDAALGMRSGRTHGQPENQREARCVA